MSGLGSILFEQITEALEKDQLVLPTLPEVALMAREVAQDPMVTTAKLAQAVEKDPAISARLIKVANSPLMRTMNRAADLKAAISRLGMNFTCNLIVGFAMEQMFHASSEVIELKMRSVWAHSASIAAKSAVLAQQVKLPADEAVLVGLVHAIGVLPILTFIEENVENFSDEFILDQVLLKISQQVGRVILVNWEFSEALTQVPEASLDLFRNNETSDKPDFSDLVLVANLMTDQGFFAPAFSGVNWHQVSAFKRLKLNLIEEKNEVSDIEELLEKFEAMSDIFSVK